MRPGGNRLSMLIFPALFLIAAAFLPIAVSQNAPQGSTGHVTVGTWGGTDLQMDVTPQGATLDFDCAQGTASEPLLLDAGGGFHVKGFFYSQNGGPSKNKPSSRGVDVVYAGKVEGDSMRLEFSLGDSKENLQSFTLTRGKQGNLRRCR